MNRSTPTIEMTTIRCTPASSPTVCRLRAAGFEERRGLALVGRRLSGRVDDDLHPGERLREALARDHVDPARARDRNDLVTLGLEHVDDVTADPPGCPATAILRADCMTVSSRSSLPSHRAAPPGQPAARPATSLGAVRCEPQASATTRRSPCSFSTAALEVGVARSILDPALEDAYAYAMTGITRSTERAEMLVPSAAPIGPCSSCGSPSASLSA